ncbi:uncharacterized protein LOC122089853 isoform X2 [Macadamia integrifolia]|uniref:uncharacterized protein LOC122089853 isoform X2 n=1 Tax=Macadamia integrifolia TaxID=60698 RepID=UPI001C4EE961|nr:uncharacterized protein LOC122089853 isoform X2 [Macadamia integrifolia]
MYYFFKIICFAFFIGMGSPVEPNPISLESEVLINDIPILTEENCLIWKEKMEKFLKKKGFWDYLVGAKREPENTSSDEYKDWMEKKKEIMSIFTGKCGARTLTFIEDLDITLIWSQLVTMFEFTYPPNTGKMKRSTNYTWSLPFYKAIVDGNWKSVSDRFVSKNVGALTVRLTSIGNLPVHVAVEKGKVEIAKELLKRMPADHLLRQDKYGRTVLKIAASGGNKEMVKAIVEKDEKLVMIKGRGYIPIVHAAFASKKDVVNYLYPITVHQEANQKEDDGTDKERDQNRAILLTALIFGDFYGHALDLLQKYPRLLLTNEDTNWTAIEALAMKRTAFKSSLPIKSVGTFGYYFIYSLLDVHADAKNPCWRTREDVEISFDANKDSTQENMMMYCGLYSTNCIILQFCKGLWLRFHGLFQNALIKLVPGCKNIYEEKLKHYEASALLKEMWSLVSEVDDLTSVAVDLASTMSKATENGTVEFIEECINKCPQLLLWRAIGKRGAPTVFHYAIIHRQEKVFGLIHHLSPSMKNDLAIMRDESENLMSHLAAEKAPIHRLNQIPGAALQMQREILWFKEVESLMYSIHETKENIKYKTSRTLFSEEHKDLVKEGATWLKDTSTQCMVVATLITTIMFQAVFTIPSHIGGGGGESNDYIQGKFPIIFVISNILSLCSSVASMLMFLAIITSRYAEEDFFLTLPRMLMLGLLFLFISIVGMMIAFVAAILFMLRFNVRLWVSFPITFLASVPITIYALVELPLFIQLMFTTSSSAVFGKRKLNKHA